MAPPGAAGAFATSTLGGRAGGDSSEGENKPLGEQANTANLGFLLRKGSRSQSWGPVGPLWGWELGPPFAGVGLGFHWAGLGFY